MKKRLLAALAVGISMLSIANMANAVSWSNQTASTVTVTDIGSLGWGGTHGYGINNAGQVAGDSYYRDGGLIQNAILWDPTRGMSDLGVGTANGINNVGQVTGQSSSHAFIWDSSNGSRTDLGTLAGGNNSIGYGINDAGQVTGISNGTNAYNYHAFAWDTKNGMVDLGTFGGVTSSGQGINNVGQVAGWSYTDPGSGTLHPFLWDQEGGMIDLGAQSYQSYGKGINDIGQVTGYSNSQAFIWDAKKGMVALGSIGGWSSYGLGINNLSQVVGNADTEGYYHQNHAFVWEDGKIYDLNSLVNLDSSQEYLQFATAINDLSQIVANSNFGKTYVLTPSAYVVPVPVPGAALLLCSGLLGLAGLGRRKKAAVA